MKVAAFSDKRKLKIVETQYPKLSPDGIIIKIKTCGICGSDLHVFNKGLFLETSTKDVNGYKVLGHEFAGEIVEIGENINGFKIGDRVICAHIKGGFAEYIQVEGVIKNINVFNLPNEISFEEAATLEPLFTSYHAVLVSQPESCDTVTIIGTGIIGIGILQILKTLYSTTVIVTDISNERLKMAKDLNADYVINSRDVNFIEKINEITGSINVRYLTDPSPKSDIVYDCAGTAITPEQACKIVKPVSGKIILLALYEKISNVNFNFLVAKNAVIYGSLGYYPKEVLQCINLVRSGKINRKALITHEYLLNEIQTAFEEQLKINEAFKTIIVME